MGFSIRNANESDSLLIRFSPKRGTFQLLSKDHFQIGIKQYFQQAFLYSTHNKVLTSRVDIYPNLHNGLRSYPIFLLAFDLHHVGGLRQ
jgi:hypothetical protein